MNAFFKTKKKKDREVAFIKNGGMVLEKLIGFCNGKCNPIRGFSEEELKRATNNYEAKQVLCKDGFFTLYKGFLQDRPILVKKFKEHDLSLAINEIPFASHMSVHKNVLKLLGCCLETEIPILVFESVKNGNLDDHLCSPNNAHFQPLLWKHRLKIAMDIANVVAYLHTAFPKPIIHRDIKTQNILLDEHYVAKLTDFSLSISIPDGETHVENLVEGTLGFLDSEYLQTSRCSEKIDVYGFGVCLPVLLTGKNAVYVRDDDIDNKTYASLVPYVMDYIIMGEGPWPEKDNELQSFAALALRCASKTEDDRPAMIDVAKELRQMYQSRSFPI